MLDVLNYDTPFELISDTCYAEDSRYLEEDLIKIASHSHPLSKEDDAAVYCRLEEATRSTVNSTSINPFQRKKDDRNAWSSVVKHDAGVD